MASLQASAGLMHRATRPEPAAWAGKLATLVYRSDAVRPFSKDDLLGLTHAAQTRNHEEAVTGLVVYDNAQFFQWLEGPEESLSRIMDSISHDERHTNIEVIVRQRTARRKFSGWDMKLAVPGASAALWTREVLTASREMLETLRSRPEVAASVLEGMAPRQSVPDKARVLAVLGSVIRTSVIPACAIQHGIIPAPLLPLLSLPLLHPRGDELADMLLRDGTGTALPVVRETPDASQTHLAESAARRLGDMWMDDSCSEVEVTAALCALQTVLLRLEQDGPAPNVAFAGVALVAPFPGEPHGLEAALSARTLRRAGWSVRCAFPENDAELRRLLTETWFDVAELSLSAAFRREERRDPLAGTVKGARQASQNQELRVNVAGRMFAEDADEAARMGADTPFRGRSAA